MICQACGVQHFQDVCPGCRSIVGQEHLRRLYDTEGPCPRCGKGLHGATECTECGYQVPGVSQSE